MQSFNRFALSLRQFSPPKYCHWKGAHARNAYSVRGCCIYVFLSLKTLRVLWAHICVWRKLSVWTKDTYVRLSIFPNTYAEVILLRLCEININAFFSNDSKQMPIMPRYNSRLNFSRTVASNYQEENVLFVWKIRECRKCDVGLCIDNCFEILHTQLNY